MSEKPRNLLDRSLNLFSDVREGEGVTALLMLTNVFLLLFAYYVIKTVREPLIIASGGAELRSYASAAQAGVLLLFIPLYSLVASRLKKVRLILGVTAFFIVNLEIFFLLAQFNIPNLGFYFYIWVGIFSVSIIAQFWSYANDRYTRAQGERLFPLIALGATIGGATGPQLAKQLFKLGIDEYSMLHVAAGLLMLNLVLFYWIHQRFNAASPSEAHDDAPSEKKDVIGDLLDGFRLVFQKRFLTKIAVVILLLNLVNTVGEYVLSKTFEDASRAHVTETLPEASAIVSGADVAIAQAQSQGSEAVAAEEAKVKAAKKETKKAFKAHIGSLYADFYSFVGLLTLLLQAFVVSRLVKFFGIAGALFVLPIIALGAYSVIAIGAGLTITQWVKTAENSTDYSIMNTGKALLWLPTSRDEKYKAKQAIDTFFARLGDALQALIVFVGLTYFDFSVANFATLNIVLVCLWLVITASLVREYKTLAAETEG